MPSGENVLCVTDPQDDRTSMILSLASAVLSIIGSSLTITYFSILLKKNKDNPNGNLTLYKLILLLGICDLFGALFICIQDSQLLVWSAAYNKIRCSIFRIAIQFFYTSTFFWTSFIAVVIFKEIQEYKVRTGNVIEHFPVCGLF